MGNNQRVLTIYITVGSAFVNADIEQFNIQAQTLSKLVCLVKVQHQKIFCYSVKWSSFSFYLKFWGSGRVPNAWCL